MVAAVAVVAVAFSTVVVMAIWQLWRDPPDFSPDLVTDRIMCWDGLRFTWEIEVEDGSLEQICIRRKPEALPQP